MTSLFEYGRVESPCLILLLRNCSKSDRTCISILVALLEGGGKKRGKLDYSSHVQRHKLVFIAQEKEVFALFMKSVCHWIHSNSDGW